jgi:preprotein translocase subunit SecD
MFKTLKARVIVILGIVALCGWYLYDNYQQSGSLVRLGLDLQGGMHLVLEVDDPEGTMSLEARSDAIDRAERIIRNRVDELGVEEPIIQKVGQDRLIVELAGIDDEQRARDLIGQTAMLEWKLVIPVSRVEPAFPRIDRAIVATLGVDSLRALGQAVEADDPGEERVEDLLFRRDRPPQEEPEEREVPQEIDEQVELDEEEREIRPFTAMLLQGRDDGEFLVAQEDYELARMFLGLPQVQTALPRNVTLQWGWEPIAAQGRMYRQLYVLERDAFLTGDMLEDASATREQQFNQPIVQFQLSRAGGRLFSDKTGRHIGDRIAILLDDEVVSAPVVRSRIGARGQIELGQADMAEATDLALVLRAGALPAPLRIMEERTVGPSLGQDSIDQGMMAGIIGLILVVMGMIVYYRFTGLLAITALLVYVAILLGGLAMLNATLTLPGIAGIILSIGMAVDANVLIFERIREELDAGRAVRTAVDEGFAHALSAIVHANITTLITALILFQVGTGPVRGFAVTLSIGIVASFFTALYVTRTLYLIYLRGKTATDTLSI